MPDNYANGTKIPNSNRIEKDNSTCVLNQERLNIKNNVSFLYKQYFLMV